MRALLPTLQALPSASARALLVSAAAALPTAFPAAAQSEPPDFDVVVTRFEWEGGGRLGYNVAFALTHEVFRTFDMSIPADTVPGERPGPNACCLATRPTARLFSSLPEQSHDRAFALARSQGAVMAVWGRAWPYGDEVVVQAYLTITGPPAGTRTGETVGDHRIAYPFTSDGAWAPWTLRVGADGPVVGIGDLPERRYELPPIVFDAASLARFGSFQDMPVYAAMDSTSEVISRTGAGIVALQHVREWSKIEVPGVPDGGWIVLPSLGIDAGVQFIAGLVHFMRGNWRRARTSFDVVMGSEDVPAELRRDAALLLAAAEFNLDPTCARCLAPIDRAKRLNPLARTTARYEMMARLAMAMAADDTAAYSELSRRVAEEEALFPPDDPFTRQLTGVLEALGAGGD